MTNALRPRVLILANPIAGRGRAPALAAALEDALLRRGIPATVRSTPKAGHAMEASDLTPDVGTVVVVGGDGSLRDLVNELPDLSLRVGMLAAGTGNMMAKELELPRRPEPFADLVLAGETRRFDVCRAAGRRFLQVAGVGFDAECARAVGEVRDGPIRMTTYVLPVLKTLLGFEHPHLRVRLRQPDGAELVFEDVLAIIASNIKAYGGPFEFTSHAHPNSGHLDVVIAQGPVLRTAALAMLGALCRIAHRVPGIRILPAVRVTVDAETTVPVQLDGDARSGTPVVIETSPESIEFIAPRGSRLPPPPRKP